MDLKAIVEHIELELTTGEAKKDEDTNFRAHVYSTDNQLLVQTHWLGTGGYADEWFGSGCTYYPGPNLPNWINTFDIWRASHPGAEMTLGHLRGARLILEIGSFPQTDHWQVKARVFAKVRGAQTLVPVSPDPGGGGFTGIASDGEHGWPSTVIIPFSLVVPDIGG